MAAWRGGKMLAMIDRLDSSSSSSLTRPEHSLDIAASQSPPVALEYQPPQPRLARRGDMVWGVIISLLIANGVGWMLFGMLMMARVRDDEAGPVAVGAAFIIFGLGIAGSLAWTRRQQQSPQTSR
jgi:hypothetical protein